MRNAKVQDFYVDAECKQLKKSFTVDRQRLIFEDFDLDGWTFLGFNECFETNIPSNLKGDMEPEKYYLLNFYPIGDYQYTMCTTYDPDDMSYCKFSKGKTIYQVKVSEEFMHNFVKEGLFACQSLKSVISTIIEKDKYYNQNWHPMPFMLLDDNTRSAKDFNAAMKARLKQEVRNGKLDSKKAEVIKTAFENVIAGKLKRLDAFYFLNPGKMSQYYKAYVDEQRRASAARVAKEQAKIKRIEAMKRAKQNALAADASLEVPELKEAPKTTKSDKTKG